MAQGRMLRKAISFSETIEAMTEFAQLLFDRIVIHTDDFGLIDGSPAKVKAITKPLSARPPEDFANAVAEMVGVGAIDAYAVLDRPYLHVTEFERHQAGLKRRTASDLPSPEIGIELDAEAYLGMVSRHLPGNSQKFTARREEKRREENGIEREGATAPRPDPFDALRSFDDIWSECLANRVPNPVHKAAAKRSYLRTVKCAADAEKCRLARMNYSASRRVREGFVQDASTWFYDWSSWVDLTPEPQRGPDGLTISAQEQINIDLTRDFILNARSDVRRWKRLGEKADEWPLTDISPEEWEAFEAWHGDEVRSIEEFRAERMVTA